MERSDNFREAYRAFIRHALGPTQVVEYPDGLLTIDEHGKVAACDAYEKLFPKLPKGCVIHDYRGSWIVPGFVDCHVHLPQLDCRNKNGLILLDWLTTYIYPMEAKFADPKVAFNTAHRFFDELLAHGITTAAIYSTVHFQATEIAFQVAKEKGLRTIIGQVLNDQNVPPALLRPTVQLLGETERLITKWHGKEGRLFCAVTPRFALTCSKDLIKESGEMATQSKAYFQTHLAETKEEVIQAKELYRFKNYAAFYEQKGCLGDKSLFAHCIYLESVDWKILSGYHCAVAHCPTSNVFLKSGTMPFAKAEKLGLRCGFGTDVGAGPTFSMREVADCACEAHSKEAMNPTKAFYLATLGGAEALSLGNQIGNFLEGKWADFSVFADSGISGKTEKVYIAGQCISGSIAQKHGN